MKNARKFRNLLISKLNRLILKDECCSREDMLKKDDLDFDICGMLESYIGAIFFENIVEKSGINIKDVSFENIIILEPTIDDAVCGMIRTLKGNVFLGFMFGGDWQFPINGVLYYDHGFKLYVPKIANGLKNDKPFNNDEVDENFRYDACVFYEEIENELGI